jgi:hypothetical protein
VDGDQIYFRGKDEKISRLNISGGDTLVQNDKKCVGRPQVQGESVYFISDDHYLYKLPKDFTSNSTPELAIPRLAMQENTYRMWEKMKVHHFIMAGSGGWLVGELDTPCPPGPGDKEVDCVWPV